jgi:hypothetical protein
VKKSALVLLDTRDRGPLPVVEDAARVDKNVCVIADGVAGDIVAHLDVVSVLLVVPDSANDLMLSLDVSLETILVGESIEVLEDLCCWRIDC